MASDSEPTAGTQRRWRRWVLGVAALASVLLLSTAALAAADTTPTDPLSSVLAGLGLGGGSSGTPTASTTDLPIDPQWPLNTIQSAPNLGPCTHHTHPQTIPHHLPH